MIFASSTTIGARIEVILGRAVEVAAGILVAFEIAILFAGFVFRYIFNRPFTWSDELASILFLWLAMLGAVVAYRRGEHMRMTALVNNSGPRRRAIAEALALAAGLAFLAFIMHPAVDYAIDEIMIITPALEVSNVWRSAALPVGIGLMLIFGVLRIGRAVSLADMALALLLIVIVGAGFYLAKPIEQRSDVAKLNDELKRQISSCGLRIVDVRSEEFRAKLENSGLYKKWKDRFGSANWAILESSTGPIA